MIKHETILLPNNTRLVLSQDKSKHQTYAEISVCFGGLTSKYKYLNKRESVTPGIAHLLEHYLVEHNLYGNMFDYLKDKYVDFNARTSATETSFYIDTVYDFETHLEELIRIVNMPIFDESVLANVKKPIIEEIKRTKDRPYFKFNQKMNDCSYREIKVRETTGTEKSVNGITVEEMKKIHDIFYQPKNQTIFIAGNFDIKKVVKQIEDIYASINRETLEYQILDKKETAKVRHKKGHVVDPEYDELINISFKVDLSKLTPKERVKSTFYLSHFLNYNFNDSSTIYQTLTRDKDTVYSISTGTTYFIKDICFIDIGMYGTNVKKFKRLVLDVIKNKYCDKEMFELWKKECLINMIIRESRVYSSGTAFLENIKIFDYLDVDKISDIEAFSLKDYEYFLNKLDFSNYTIVTQTKK